MSINISHAGTILTISASVTYNVPVPLLEFPDDVDPVTWDDVTIGDGGVGTNGHAAHWSKATLHPVTISVFAETTAHLTLKTIFDANKVRPGKIPAYDKIQIVRVMPNGTILTAKGGWIETGPGAVSQLQTGRIKTVSYAFKFEEVDEVIAVAAVSNLLG